MYEIACCVNAGIKEQNDDRVMIGNRVISEGTYDYLAPIGFAVVCDGVGGELFGNEAADIATEYYSKVNPIDMNEDRIIRTVEEVNDLILDAQKKDLMHRYMSSTLAGIVLNDEDFIAFNVGDSRVYRYREPYLALLTKDHSVNQERLELGLDKLPEFDHVITRYLGSEHFSPDIILGKHRALKDDIFVLCSDGISDVLPLDDLCNCFATKKKLNELAEDIVAEAKKRHSKDNMSIALLKRIDYD